MDTGFRRYDEVSSCYLRLCGLFHRREAGRLQDRILDTRNDRAVLLGLGALGVPFRVSLECVPFLFAVGERLPLEQVVKSLVRIANRRGPEAGLLDAVALPDS